MKRFFTLRIIAIIILSFLTLCSCDILPNSSSDRNGEDNETQETTDCGDAPGYQYFASMEELLLAINDIDAFCEEVKYDGHGNEINSRFVKDNLDELAKYPFAYMDNYKSFFMEMFSGGMHVTFVTENDIEYNFAYIPGSDTTPVIREPRDHILKINDQVVEMCLCDPAPREHYYEFYGVWKNEDMYVTITVIVERDYTEFDGFEEFYTVDLVELASEYDFSN